MNNKRKQHQEFLANLNYYDSSQFITSTNNHASPKTTPKIRQQSTQNTTFQFDDIFSMQHMKQFNQIKSYIQNEHQSLPLLIKSQKNKGKKTLLSQIINHYQKYDNKTKIFIAHFSQVNKIYSEILYNIMVKLRITFDINQKVEVNEEKIRRYFKYWLDVTSDKIQKDNIGYLKTEKQTLIIIIDGINNLTDSKYQKVFPQFWLPQKIPKNVKLILSGTSGELCIQKLCHENKVKIINLSNKILSQKLMSQLKPQIQQLLNQKKLSLFQIKTINWFLNNAPKLRIQKQQTFNEIVSNYIVQCSSKKLSQNEIKSLLLCLSLSKKGLKEEELQKIMKLRAQSIIEFLYMFQPFINHYQSYYLITNTQIKNYIQNVYDPNKQKKRTYHEVMARVLKKQQLSIRKLQQEIHHLIQAANYFEIKQVISQIQNFLVLYTPPCKYLLFNSWKILQKQLNSDPVFQYNKAVESFLTHYHPKQEQLFKIIYQLSMFFREYSDFQGAKIPNFRHPLIKGQEEQLQLISVHDQLKHYNMITSLKQVQKKRINLQQQPRKNSKQKTYPLALTKSKVALGKTKKSPTKKIQNALCQSQNQLQRLSQMKQKDSTLQPHNQSSQQTSQQQQFECINLQIKLNRQKFRNKYLQILEPYFKQFYSPIKKLYMNDIFIKSSNNNNTEMEEDQELQEEKIQQITEQLLKEPSVNLQKIKSTMILKNLDQYFQENYHRQDNTKFYYYKQWIWIQFPWICQSLNSNFSQMIQKYIGSPTQYMSIQKQISLIKDVLKISKVSKENKSAIYENKPIQLLSINVSKVKRNKKQLSMVRNSIKEEDNKCRLTMNGLKTQDISMNNSHIQPSPPNQNIAKFQLNLQNIDQKLNEQLKKQLTNRCLYDSRILTKSRAKLSTLNNDNLMNLNKDTKNLFITQSEQRNSNQKNKLPYIIGNMKQSRYVKQNSQFSHSKNWSSIMNPSTLKQKYNIHQKSLLSSYDKKSNKNLTQLNLLINQNKQLKQRIQQLQKTSIMLQNIDEQTPYEKNKQKVQFLTEIKHKIVKKHEVQQKLKEKLQTIIKICDNNQSHEKESQLLCAFLDNLKVMTGLEENSTEGLKNGIERFVEENKKAIKELVERKQTLLNELKEYGGSRLLKKQEENEQQTQTQLNEMKNPTNKKNVSIKKTQTSIHRDKNGKATTFEGRNNKRTNTTTKYTMAQKNKTAYKSMLSKTLKLANSEIYAKLEQIFDYDPQNYQQSVQNAKYLIEQFQQKVIKYKQLNLQLQQIQYENDSLDQTIQKMNEDLKTLVEKNQTIGQNKNQMNLSEELVEKRKLLGQMKARTKLLEECMKEYSGVMEQEEYSIRAFQQEVTTRQN